VERGKVELTENRLILGQFYSTAPPSPSIQMDHKVTSYLDVDCVQQRIVSLFTDMLTLLLREHLSLFFFFVFHFDIYVQDYFYMHIYESIFVHNILYLH